MSFEGINTRKLAVFNVRAYGIDLTQTTLKEWALKEGLDADIASMTQAEKAMLRYQYVMAHTTLVQGDFADTADTWANQIKMLKQNFQELGAVLGTVFINAFKPMIQAMNNAMSKIISFVQTVADAFGAIFGWTIEITSGGQTISDEMLDAADASEDLAEGTGSAAGNAADTAKALTVLPFDELNQMNDTKSSGGSGGGGGGGSSSGSGASNTGGLTAELKRVDTVFKNIESQLNTLDRLGTYLSISMTSSLRKIDWDSIYAGAKDFGTGLATFLNALIKPNLFAEVGKTIAGALNTAIYTALAFGQELDWTNLGTAIGAGITAWAETFDFKAAGQTWNTFATGILDMILSAVSTIDWQAVGDGIADFISQIDFHKLVTTLLEILGVVFKGVLTALGTIIEEAPIEGALIAAFSVFKFTNFGTTLAGLILKAVIANIGTAAGTTVAAGGATATATGGAVATGAGAGIVGTFLGPAIGAALTAGLAFAYSKYGNPIAQKFADTYSDTPGIAEGGYTAANDSMVDWAVEHGYREAPTTSSTVELSPSDEMLQWAENMGFRDRNASDFFFGKNGRLADLFKKHQEEENQRVIDTLNDVALPESELVNAVGYGSSKGFIVGQNGTGGGGVNTLMKQHWGINFGLTLDLANASAIANGMNTTGVNAGSSFITGLTNSVNSKMGSVTTATRNIGTTMNNGLVSSTSTITASANNIMTSVANALNRNMSPTGANVASTYSSGISSKNAEAQGAGAGLRNQVASGANTSLYGIGSTIASTFKSGLQSVYIPTPHVTMTAASKTSILEKIASGITNAISVAKSKVDWYAAGGLATGARVIGVGEAGDEAILPLTNRRTMSRIADAISSSGGGFDSNGIERAVERGVVTAMMNNPQSIPDIYVTSILKADSEVLARTVQKGQTRLNYRNSATAH